MVAIQVRTRDRQIPFEHSSQVLIVLQSDGLAKSGIKGKVRCAFEAQRTGSAFKIA
jgi:hypothetical protein